MKAIFLASALLLTATLSPASAAPMAPLSVAPAVEQPLVDVQYDRDRRDYRRDNRSRYRAGQRYRSAPSGWRRYDRRPGDWSRRGCVLVGPVWFCP